MTDTEKLDVIREILDWKYHDDDVKFYFVKTFLLGWNDAEYIHTITERDKINQRERAVG